MKAHLETRSLWCGKWIKEPRGSRKGMELSMGLKKKNISSLGTWTDPRAICIDLELMRSKW